MATFAIKWDATSKTFRAAEKRSIKSAKQSLKVKQNEKAKQKSINAVKEELEKSIKAAEIQNNKVEMVAKVTQNKVEYGNPKSALEWILKEEMVTKTEMLHVLVVLENGCKNANVGRKVLDTLVLLLEELDRKCTDSVKEDARKCFFFVYKLVSSIVVCVRMGRLYLKFGRSKKAKDKARMVLDRDKDAEDAREVIRNGVLYEQLCSIARHLCDTDKATRCIVDNVLRRMEKAITIAPLSMEIVLMKAKVLHSAKEYAQTILLLKNRVLTRQEDQLLYYYAFALDYAGHSTIAYNELVDFQHRNRIHSRSTKLLSRLQYRNQLEVILFIFLEIDM